MAKGVPFEHLHRVPLITAVAIVMLAFGSPAARAADPVIAAAGDIACAPPATAKTTGCRQLDTSNLLVGAGLAGVLMLGDGQYNSGQLADYTAVYDPSWGRVKTITHPAPGNHEYQTSGASGYYDYFNGTGVQTGQAGDRTKGYYSYDIGAWHLIALNSNCGSVSCAKGSGQEQWLKNDLTTNPKSCTLAYLHHPRFSSGQHGNAASTTPLWQALYAAGADIVLAGHDHDYERFAPQGPTGVADPVNGIREFVVGTGGASHYTIGAPKPNSQARSSDTFGVLQLTLRATGYDWRFVPVAGSSFTDSGSADCHRYPAPAAASPIRTSLVPVYRECGTQQDRPNGKHASPLSVSSCRPPRTLSTSHMGRRAVGTATISAIPGNPATPASEADASFAASISDVRAAGSNGPDYNPSAAGPDMTLSPKLRITDLRNSAGQGAGSATDLRFAVPVNCASTADTTIGSNCAVNTTANALAPGMMVESRKTVIQLSRIRVDDAGPNGVRGDGDDTLLAQQGFFVP